MSPIFASIVVNKNILKINEIKHISLCVCVCVSRYKYGFKYFANTQNIHGKRELKSYNIIDVNRKNKNYKH